ncbi:ABC transporter permease [Mycoplasma sp. Sp48II]|uniref:ABC transporter permease n=1 Tax=Mycoplasma sp. Sp48II TaxID=3401682 RepID=UPI003AAFB4D2
MKNLFKEVFRSLFRNKATVAGLTILVFLTSGIFTLLHDTAQSMKLQYNKIKDKSISHDLTIDLNLSTNAKAYNDGYLINGLAQADALPEAYNKPILYVDDNYKKSVDIIDLRKVEEDFVLLKNFIDDPNYADGYIKKTDFIKMYNLLKSDDVKNSVLKLDYSQAKKTFTLASNYSIDLFTKELNGTFIPSKKEVKLTSDTQLHFDKQYQISDIAYVTESSEGKILSQVSTMFINVLTKEITFNLIKGQTWKKTAPVIEVQPSEFIATLGFKPYNDQKLVFVQDNNIKPSLVNDIANVSVAQLMQTKLADFVAYEQIFGKDKDYVTTVEKEYFQFNQGQVYNVPLKWAARRETVTYYQRKVYESTYIKYKDKWEGAYVAFMEHLIKSNPEGNETIPARFKEFSYWSKNISNYIYNYDANGQLISSNPELVSQQEPIVSKDEALKTPLMLAPINQQYGVATVDAEKLFFVKGLIDKTVILAQDFINNNKTDAKYSQLIEAVQAILDQYQAKIKQLNNPTYDQYKALYDELSSQLKEVVKDRPDAFTVPEFDDHSGTEIPNYNAYEYQKPRTIAFIEHFDENTLSDNVYTRLVNKNILHDTFNEIKSGALAIVKQNIYNKVKEQVGADNIGIKQQLTIDSFDEKTQEKNVFQFINVGNNKEQINGIANNINKLINEKDQPTGLNGMALEIDDFFKTKQLDYYVSYIILLNTASNVVPSPTYIKSDYGFDKFVVVDYNNPNKPANTIYGQKVYKLAHFVKDADSNMPDSEFNKFADLGITATTYKASSGYYYYIVKPVYDKEGNIDYWTNIPVSFSTASNAEEAAKHKNGLISTNDILSFLKANNLVLKATLNPNGWVEKSSEFNNVVYVPFGYRAPLAEIMNEAINQKTMNKAIENIQKGLLDMDLVKEGFLTKDTVYAITDAAQYTFDKNDFAGVFASGQINLNIIPKLVIDALYKLSHNINGDYVNKILTGIFAKAKALVLQQPTVEEQQKYLESEIQTLYNFFGLIGQNTLAQYITPQALVRITKDPVKFIDSLIKIINSVDFVKYTDSIINFLNDEYNKIKEETVNDPETREPRIIKRQRKLSTHQMIIWLLKSIDQDTLKTGLKEIVNNINLEFIQDSEDNNNPLYYVLKNMPPFVNNIINKVNAYKGTNEQFKNVLDGIKYLIDAFDISMFADTLESKLKLEKFQLSSLTYNYILDRQITTYYFYLADSLSNIDYIYATLKALFSIPGSNRSLKEELIRSLNLSDKGTSIKISGDRYLTIPAADTDKLGYFDLLGAISSTPNQPSANANSTAAPVTASSIPFNRYGFNSIYNFIRRFKYALDQGLLSEVDYTKLDHNDKTLAHDIFGIDGDNPIIKASEALVKINSIQAAFEALRQSTISPTLGQNSSLADIITWYQNVVPVSQNQTYQLLREILGKFLKPNNVNSDDFAAIGTGYLLYKFWLSIFTSDLQDKYTFDEKIAFANNLLDLANNKEVLDSFNSFDLFQPSASNIIGYETTGFGITRSMANIFEMKNYFFATDENGNYKNPLLAQFVAQNSKFTSFIKENEINITKAFAYIGSSHLYTKVTLEPTNDAPTVAEDDRHFTSYKYDNADSNAIYTIINSVLANKAVQANFDYIAFLIDTNYNKMPSLIALGIPDLIFSNILVMNHPEFVVWYLTDTNKVGDLAKNNANIAYLVANKIINYESLIAQNPEYIYQLIQASVKRSVPNPVFERDKDVSLAIDNDILYNWLDKTKNDTSVKYNPFEVNLMDVLLKTFNTITGVNKLTNILKYDQVGSYIAKVNYAWLQRNNKKIFNGALPKDPNQMLALVAALPEEYKISVNGSEYIIIGDDLTYDNIYPVLDENNLQLNPKSQAVVYVNSQGFDRIKQAYRGNVVKEYLLVRNSTAKSNEILKNELDKIIKAETINKDDFQRVFLDDELDMLNPERSIRITAMKGIVRSVDYSAKVLLSILVTLVAISIIFIIKRYISNKNKVIGILVAQGYTPLEISLSMTVFAFFTIFIGDILGYITGFLLQGVGIKILDNYWTVPIETLTFSWISLLVNIVVPLFAMSLLIIIVSLRSLRFKSIDLMSGIVDVATGEVYKKYAKAFKKRNVKGKFSASLVFNSFWKLSSFGISIILTSLTTLFGFATFGVFEESINKTYQNRNYNYRFDLYSPTLEGGPINPYQSTNLENNLYVPIGNISELDQYQSDYFKPGYSTAVNILGKNGNPSEFDGHVISQFSVNIIIDSVVGVDPWTSVYNSLPDSQKSRILKVRDKIGKALEKTQSNIVYDQYGAVDHNKTSIKGLEGFFEYFPDKDNVMNGKFYYMALNSSRTGYDMKAINTTNYRDPYREFLVQGYKTIAENNDKAIAKNPKAETINDFFISFGGLYFNPIYDEIYTYVDANILAIKNKEMKEKSNNQNVRLYGYLPDSKEVKIIGSDGEDLLKKINDQYNQNPDDNKIPLIINEVVAQSYGLWIGQSIEIKANNTIDRYQNKINSEIGQNNSELRNKTYKFVVAGINPSYINNEFIIPKAAADKITGINNITYNPAYNNGAAFNGVLSNNPLPMQILNSASLYSISGYWASIDSFDTERLTSKSIGELFDGIFGSTTTVENSKVNGAMRNIGYSDVQIAKFFNPTYSGSQDVNALKESYIAAKADATKYIQKFARIFEDKLYVPSAASIDSKDIEVNYTMTIAKTVQIVVTIISILTFIVSIVILIIISTILINENEKNIAIWAVLGYNEKEKLKIFFGIYIPFIVTSILISLPIAYGLISVFSAFLTNAAKIAIPLAITAANAFLTIGVILFVFIVTASLAWIALNKIKAIDLLKGK